MEKDCCNSNDSKIFLYFVLFGRCGHYISDARTGGNGMEYGALALFQGIADGEVEAMIRCFRMRRGRYEAGEIICA